MTVRIGSNISSLGAQRRLADISGALARTLERLSSGQRINRASDDAAGLAIAETLGTGKRVFTQGVRNLNDGLSALQIADSAIGNLSQIVTRIRELAEQAANGSLSVSQRKALDAEAKELSEEYLRIARETSFNGVRLLDGSLKNGLRLQGGFGESGSIQSALGGTKGDGTFSPRMPIDIYGTNFAISLGDLNGDGASDMVTGDYYNHTVGVFIGKGDGTFLEQRSFSTGLNPRSVGLGDLNGDGKLDIVSGGASGEVSVFLGNGDGTFGQAATFSWGSISKSLALGDLDGDGVLDIAAAGESNDSLLVVMGHGDGTFSAVRSYASQVAPQDIALGDVDGDGLLDAVSSSYDGSVRVLIGGGDGTFSAGASFVAGDNSNSVALGDLNGDGRLDVVTADRFNSMVNVLIGKGDGTFAGRVSYAAASDTRSVTLGDLNGDGVLDVVAAEYYASIVSIFMGKGDGTLGPLQWAPAGFTPTSVTLGDLNGDGVLDIATANYNPGELNVLLGDTCDGVGPLLPFSLTSQSDALQALAPLDRKLAQLAEQRGVIGSFQSRLGAAASTLQSISENYAAAESRIRDADIAAETAEMTRLQISRQAAAAVLAQANLQPSLAVTLLR